MWLWLTYIDQPTLNSSEPIHHYHTTEQTRGGREPPVFAAKILNLLLKLYFCGMLDSL